MEGHAKSVAAALREARVGDTMHVGLVHCPGSTPLRAVARIMAAHRIHAVCVDGGLDVVSDRDVVEAFARHDVDSLTAVDLAAAPSVVVSVVDTLADAAEAMARSHATHALVVATDGPVGILSALDLAEAVAAD
jgi:CBS domain-containing protein